MESTTLKPSFTRLSTHRFTITTCAKEPSFASQSITSTAGQKDSMSRLGKLDRVGDPVDVRNLDPALLWTRRTEVVLSRYPRSPLHAHLRRLQSLERTFQRDSGLDGFVVQMLVSGEWRMLSLPHLYRHLHITTSAHSNLSPQLFAHSHLVRTMDLRRAPTPGPFDSRILRGRSFPSLEAIYGLTIDLSREDHVPHLALVAPDLRTLELRWPCSDLDDTQFSDALSLPTSLKDLDVVIDEVDSEDEVGQDCLRVLLETGKSTSDGTKVKRSLPNLRRLKIHFLFDDDGFGPDAPLSFPPTLQNLQLLLAHLGPNLVQLGLSLLTLSGLPPSAPASFPVHAISLCPPLQTLHTFNLHIQDVLAEPQRSVEQLDVGPLKLHTPPQPDIFSYGQGTITPSTFEEDVGPPEGDVVWEVIDHFSRERWPLLRRLRLTLANWEFKEHRELAGLEENRRALRLLGIELVDRWGSPWWKGGEAEVEEKKKEVEEEEDAMKVD